MSLRHRRQTRPIVNPRNPIKSARWFEINAMKREKLRERERRKGTNAMKISISLLLLLPPPLLLLSLAKEKHGCPSGVEKKRG